MLVLRLLGGPSLCGNPSTLAGPAMQRHRLALLALLASSRFRPQSRDKLVAWLWPERDVEHARNLLNQGVHALRRAIGEAAIVSTHDELRLDPAVVACDVVAFEDALAAGELERAIGLYTGPFLDGFHLPGASEFEHWAAGERDRLRRSYARSLESLAEAAEERREWSSAVERWRGLVSEEPYNARVTLRLMRALDAAGDRAGALQQARLHTLLLQQEFEAGPDPDVVALAERLRTEPANGNNRKVAVRRRGVRVEVARARGRADQALAALDSAASGAWGELGWREITGNSPFYFQEYQQFIRAELLNTLGRDAEALQAYRGIADYLFHSGGPAHLRLAQIYERRREPQKAAGHYARFAELWKDCDPEFRPLVEEARRRMAP